MSSFPQHETNIIALKNLGFDVSDAMEGDEVTLESWGYDEQTDLLADVIASLQAQRKLESKLNEASKFIQKLGPTIDYDIVKDIEEILK